MHVSDTMIVDLSAASKAIWTFSKPLYLLTWSAELQSTFQATEQPSRIVVRRDGDAIRVEAFTTRQCFTSWWPMDMLALVTKLNAIGFGSVHTQLIEEDVIMLRTKKHPERVTILRKPASKKHWQDIALDRQKNHAMPAELRRRVLAAFGLTTEVGVVKAAHADKVRQVDRLVARALTLDVVTRFDKRQPFHIVDAGCGKAYLSIALTATMQELGYDVHLFGIDTNDHVIQAARNVSQTLGLRNVVFRQAAISNITSVPCTVLIALHACDTATDEALALGITNNANAMLVAPCCHKSVQRQLRASFVSPSVAPLLQHGITKERIGDILTDTLRVLLLNDVGYHAHLEEFVSLEHTLKNVLIVAQLRSDHQIRTHSAHQLQQLWGVSQVLVEQFR